MNKLKFISLGILLLILFNNSILALNSAKPISSNSLFFQIYDLSKKSYYEQIFNKDERKELSKSEKYLASAKKYMANYLADQIEIEKLYTIAETTSSPKSREKALKKARKLESSALKDGFKSLDYFKKAHEISIRIYTNAIGRIRLNDDSKNSKAGREFELQAKNLFESAKSKERTAPQQDKQLKFNALNEAKDMNIKALGFQENAFALYKNDTDVKTDLPKDNNSNVNNNVINDINNNYKDSILFPKYVEQYNPLKDENLYQSKANMILPRLNLSNEEINTFSTSNKKNQNANDLLKQVDAAYMVVDSLNFVADRTNDKPQQDKLRDAAIEKENSAFYKLTTATNMYLDVNETRYNIYKRHFPVVDQKKSNEQINKAKKYEAEADDYFNKAKNEIKAASKLMYKSDQYLKSMAANDLMLYALQLQESAYGIYFDMPDIISAEIDTSLVEANKITNETKSTKEENVSNKLSWEVLASYSYSKDKPKPINYTVKKGIVFIVQLGIYKGLLAPEKFGNVQPVIFDKFVKNPYRRYLVGEYRSAEAAELALEQVKALGYSDSYIVAMIDGQRKSYSTGTAKLDKNDDHYSFIKRSELAKIKGIKDNPVVEVSDEAPKTGVVTENKLKSNSGLAYLVQLGMYSKPVTYNELSGLSPIYTDKIANKGTRYMYGNFKTIDRAREESKKAVNKGFKDAYVVAYNSGEHISLEKAMKIEKQQVGSEDNDKTEISGNILFKLQVGAYREALNATEENKLEKSFEPRNINKQIYDDMNLYTIGNYKTYKEAEYLKKKLLEEGHKDVFIIAFDGQQKISIAEAIKKSKN